LLFGELKCTSCKKKIRKNENITIWTNSNEMKGYTFLKGWATGQKVLCDSCTQKIFKN